jgi:RNA polymerase sigma-70 factor (ECF subfamily)
MGRTAVKGKAAFAMEVDMARDAAAGDGDALASLYARYEEGAYNLAYRITGSEADAADATQEAFLRATRRLPELQDGEPGFGSCLLRETRDACHDLIEKRRPAQPSGAIPEVRDANMRLPEHQREALALRELEQLSYEGIAAIMEMNPNSVAQLVSRARINLRNELHGTVLATVAAPSRDCERALPLIAAREDEQLEAGSDDDSRLDAHLAGCERCRLGVEEMREAGAAYRAWAPVAVAPWLQEETMAKAAPLVAALRADAQPPSGTPPASPATGRGRDRPTRQRRAIAAAGLVALLLGGGTAVVLAGGGPLPSSEEPVADTQPAPSAPLSNPNSKRQERRDRRKAEGAATPSQAIAASSPPLTEAGGAPSETGAAPADQGASGLQAPQATAAPKQKPKPAPTQQSPPAPAPPEAQPATEPASEDPAQEHPSKGKGPPPGLPKGGPK